MGGAHPARGADSPATSTSPTWRSRFPLSGGYIRNGALRAAFLAAQEAPPLTQEHLVRAIQLEYREIGKLSTGGRME